MRNNAIFIGTVRIELLFFNMETNVYINEQIFK
jgi:hypothetical protein